MDLPASSSPHVRYHLDGAVLDLVLDRPERKNALSVAMYTALAEGLAWASAAAQVRVVRFRGAGGTFTSGNDLQDFMQNVPGEDGGPVGAFLRALVAFDKPLLALVQGHAVGIGTTLLLHCDLVVAAQDAKFRLPFVSLGLVPEAGSSLLLPALCGHRQAAALLMLAEPFDATTAQRCGIVNEVLPPEQAAARLDAMTATLAAHPPGALQATKRLMKAGQAPALAAAMQAEGAEFLARLQSPEAMEAFMAFFARKGR